MREALGPVGDYFFIHGNTRPGAGATALRRNEDGTGRIRLPDQTADVMTHLLQRALVNRVRAVASVTDVANVRRDFSSCRFVSLDATDDPRRGDLDSDIHFECSIGGCYDHRFTVAHG